VNVYQGSAQPKKFTSSLQAAFQNRRVVGRTRCAPRSARRQHIVQQRDLPHEHDFERDEF
jgi:hypothetical protein